MLKALPSSVSNKFVCLCSSVCSMAGSSRNLQTNQHIYLAPSSSYQQHTNHLVVPLSGALFSPLNPFFHPALVFPPSTFLFHPLNILFSPSNLLCSPSTLSDPRPFFTLLPLLGVLVAWLACCNANQISTAFGENTGLCGFGCLVCWLLGGLPMQSKYRQHFGKTQLGC